MEHQHDGSAVRRGGVRSADHCDGSRAGELGGGEQRACRRRWRAASRPRRRGDNGSVSTGSAGSTSGADGGTRAEGRRPAQADCEACRGRRATTHGVVRIAGCRARCIDGVEDIHTGGHLQRQAGDPGDRVQEPGRERDSDGGQRPERCCRRCRRRFRRRSRCMSRWTGRRRSVRR